MNVWLLQVGETLPIDINARELRTAILADKLIQRGHSVLWWASAYNHLQKKWVFDKDTDFELKNGVTIKTLKGVGYKKNVSLLRFIDLRIIAWKFKRLAQNESKPNLIITSSPSYDLAYEAILFAKKNNIPIIVDIRDLWPDIFLDYIPDRLKKIAKKVLYREFTMIKKVMKTATALVSMSNIILDWGLKYSERERTWKDKVFYLGSKRISNNYTKPKKFLDIIKTLDRKFVVTFIGTFAHSHNPSILVDCAAKLLDTDVCFVLAGNGVFFDQVKDRASSLPNFILPGWIGQNEISALLQHSHLGVCPTPIEDNIGFIPNKAFTYLSVGIPIVSAFHGELKDTIEKYQIGFYYPPNDVNALIECIKRFYNDSELHKKMSENAQRVFNEIFDADKIYEEYVEHAEKIFKDYHKKSYPREVNKA